MAVRNNIWHVKLCIQGAHKLINTLCPSGQNQVTIVLPDSFSFLPKKNPSKWDHSDPAGKASSARWNWKQFFFNKHTTWFHIIRKYLWYTIIIIKNTFSVNIKRFCGVELRQIKFISIPKIKSLPGTILSRNVTVFQGEFSWIFCKFIANDTNI